MSNSYETHQDPYCYPGTDVLINKFGIKDNDRLLEVEAALVQQRIFELYLKSSSGEKFDFAHFRKIHKYIFQDIYDWAGKVRTVRISKGATTFAYPEYIADEANRIFTKLENEQTLQFLPKPEFVRRLAWYIGELNALHPFREGNGRVLRVFCWMLGQRAGYDICFEKLTESEWVTACIDSFDGRLEQMEVLLAHITTDFI